MHLNSSLGQWNKLKLIFDIDENEDKGYAPFKFGLLSSDKIRNELGWKPKYTFETGIIETIHWYLDNQDWMDKVKSGEYQEYYEKMYSKK